MGASASVQEHGRAWWDSTRAVKETLEGGTWRQLLVQHKADVNAADPHSGRTLLHEVLQPGCRGLPAAAESVKFLVECGAASVPDGEGRTPVWYALQHRDEGTRTALLAALGEHVGKMQTEVASRLRRFITDEWPALSARAEAAVASHTASEAPLQSQSQAQPVPQELQTQKPDGKDRTSERLLNHVDGRKICFTRNDATCETPLLEWLVQLLGVQPDLGYRAKHVDSMLLGLRFVVQRVLRDVEKPSHEIEDWMAVGDWFEHLCAGYLFTCDCVDYKIDDATCDILCNEDGAPIVTKEQYHEDFSDPAVLQNHGAEYVRPALYFGMNQAMRTIGLSEGARQSAARSVFELEQAPPQLHVIETFQPLMTKLTRLIRSRRPNLTTVFRGIDRNVSAQYKVGTSVVWNAFTSTTQEQDVAKSFLYGKAGTFFVIVAKQGAAEVGFASVFPQESELLYDSNIDFRVQWKLSPTLLRMVGQPFDVIVMQEVAAHGNNNDNDNNNGNDGTSTEALSQPLYSASDQVEAVRKVLQHTALLFAEFLEGYVEGRVGDDTRVAEAETRMLLHEVDEWLAADGDAEEGAGKEGGEGDAPPPAVPARGRWHREDVCGGCGSVPPAEGEEEEGGCRRGGRTTKDARVPCLCGAPGDWGGHRHNTWRDRRVHPEVVRAGGGCVGAPEQCVRRCGDPGLAGRGGADAGAFERGVQGQWRARGAAAPPVVCEAVQRDHDDAWRVPEECESHAVAGVWERDEVALHAAVHAGRRGDLHQQGACGTGGEGGAAAGGRKEHSGGRRRQSRRR